MLCNGHNLLKLSVEARIKENGTMAAGGYHGM